MFFTSFMLIKELRVLVFCNWIVVGVGLVVSFVGWLFRHRHISVFSYLGL